MRWLREPETGDLIDEALVLVQKAPASFTGEDTVELQVHGSPAVVQCVLGVLGRSDGFRAAEPGEFTRRAVLNGRLELAAAEGLADLIVAETLEQQRWSLKQYRGGVRDAADHWRQSLVETLGLLEIAIDFSDEDIGDTLGEARSRLRDVAEDMARQLAGAPAAERLRDGFEVALVGLPNVGKSTLLNALAGRDIALTSEHAGTTRDVIEVRVDLRGLPVIFLDMAGLRDARGVEALGVERARARAESADLRVFLVERHADVARLGVVRTQDDLVILCKGDLRPHAGSASVSGKTGAGIQELIGEVFERLKDRVGAAGAIAGERQKSAVGEAVASCRLSIDMCEADRVEIAAELVRQAIQSLDRLVGRSDVDAVLDTVFARFCIGK